VDFGDAVAIATRAFGESRDHSGGMFLAHSINVAQALGRDATTAATCAAVLHEVPENTYWTIDDLAAMGVDPLVCQVLDLLTPRSGEPYMDHIRRICQTPGLAGDTARLVKVADLTLSVDRENSDALRERYEQSLPLIQTALATAAH
jgi:guanosine-3',5'-bis(diphosphate) 3'-pyrophosphohydrolase